MNSDIQITLSQQEALLVFEALAKLDESAVLDTLSDEERSALWGVEAVCEKNLDDILNPAYEEIFEKAKAISRKKGAFVPLTGEERSFLANAVSEVSNGIHIEDWEFQTRLGCERSQLLSILRKL